jgi:hypothetical protein
LTQRSPTHLGFGVDKFWVEVVEVVANPVIEAVKLARILAE